MSIKAWWRGRGFGVHSPFAFRFITDVLHHDDAYAYYAYDDLKERWSEARHRDRISLRELLAIYRVGIWAAPERVKLCGADPCGLAGAALRMAAVTDGAATGSVTVWTDISDPGWTKALAAMQTGMSFTDGRIGIVVVDPRLPLQHFTIKL